MTVTQQLLACQFPACADQMGSVRVKLRDVLSRNGLPDSLVDNLVLAVGEACMNIMQHAYGQADKGDIVLEVEVQPATDKNGKAARQLVFRLTDFARHKTCAAEMRSRPLDDIRPGGLGCHIISQVMDDVTLLDTPGKNGNVLELRKRF